MWRSDYQLSLCTVSWPRPQRSVPLAASHGRHGRIGRVRISIEQMCYAVDSWLELRDTHAYGGPLRPLTATPHAFRQPIPARPAAHQLHQTSTAAALVEISSGLRLRSAAIP